MLSRKLLRNKFLPARNFHALFLTGDKAKETYAVITPFLDFNAKLNEKVNLIENLKSRKINLDIDQLYDKWDLYRDIELRKDHLEAKRIEVANELKQLTDTKSEKPNIEYINKLKFTGKHLRDDLKLLKTNSYAIEDDFVQNFLLLPNDLHKNTPTDENTILYANELDDSSMTPGQSHLTNEKCIEYYNETCYYLKGNAAIFDLEMPFHCIDFFREKLNFINFSNPDFIRTVVAEAAGFNANDLFLLREDDNVNVYNLLHLVGNSSMLSFLGFVAKLSIFPSLLPLKCITSGKQYTPKNSVNNEGLYGANQTSVVQSFIVAENQDASDQELDKLIKYIIEYYSQFNLAFRLSYIKADRLALSESCRIHIDVYSKYLNQYITVGNVCCHSDYISKRILFNIKDSKNVKFPFIISSTLVDVTKLLAVFLEISDSSNFVVPSFLNK